MTRPASLSATNAVAQSSPDVIATDVELLKAVTVIVVAGGGETEHTKRRVIHGGTTGFARGAL